MYCKNCGQELAENDVYCMQCGQSVKEDVPAINEKKESVSFAWAVLGFFLPVVGLILFIVWKTEHPQIARKAGIGALAGVVTEVVVALVSTIISIVATIVPLAIVFGSAGSAAISLII